MDQIRENTPAAHIHTPSCNLHPYAKSPTQGRTTPRHLCLKPPSNILPGNRLKAQPRVTLFCWVTFGNITWNIRFQQYCREAVKRQLAFFYFYKNEIEFLFVSGGHGQKGAVAVDYLRGAPIR